MAVIRKIPFGYEIRGGTLAAHQEEAKLVQKIYIQYLSGQSYEMLTQELHRQSIPYLPGKPWNKNMVARILADERYLGSEYYPQLIDEQTYHAVREKLSTKATIKKKVKPLKQYNIWPPVVFAVPKCSANPTSMEKNGGTAQAAIRFPRKQLIRG